MPSLGPVSLLFHWQLENESDDHSPPLGVVMNEWRYTSTPHILSWRAQGFFFFFFYLCLFVMFMGMHLVSHG